MNFDIAVWDGTVVYCILREFRFNNKIVTMNPEMSTGKEGKNVQDLAVVNRDQYENINCSLSFIPPIYSSINALSRTAFSPSLLSLQRNLRPFEDSWFIWLDYWVVVLCLLSISTVESLSRLCWRWLVAAIISRPTLVPFLAFASVLSWTSARSITLYL